MNYELIATIGIEIIGFAVMFGVLKQKVEHQGDELKNLKEDLKNDINRLENRQNTTDKVLDDIRQSLGSLNGKMDIIIAGKLKTEDK